MLSFLLIKAAYRSEYFWFGWRLKRRIDLRGIVPWWYRRREQLLPCWN